MSRLGTLGTDSFAVERVPGTRGYYRDVRVCEDEQGLHVTGFVRRFLEPGYVRVQLVDVEGRIVAEKRVEVNRLLRSSRVRHARFEALFKAIGEPVTIKLMHVFSQD